MIEDFGSEFVNVLAVIAPDQITFAQDEESEGGDVGPAFTIIIDRARTAAGSRAIPSGVVLYFPPGRYALRQSYTLPPNVQLFFSPGALLRPALNVVLIIQGSIRAGKHQIFGYDRYVAVPARPNYTAPTGHIRLHSSLIPEVYPEWWGAFAPAAISGIGDQAGQDSTDAIQAAIDAACVYRDDRDGGVRRPSIPVVLTNHYQCNKTLVVRCPDGTPDLHLILRGSRGLAPVYGGIETITRVRPTGDTSQTECLLRLGARVDFDIQDVSFGMAASGSEINGTIDIESDGTETAARRGLFRRCVLVSGRDYGLRIAGSTGLVPRHVVVDSCEVAPKNVDYQSLGAVSVAGNDGMMLHIDGTLMGAGLLGVDAANRPIVPPHCAGIYQSGASVLVRASQFHSASGPRPSPVTDASGAVDPKRPGEVDLTRPDGQDVFLASTAGAATPAVPHFTAMQCESQSWWFLSRPHAGDEQVVLLSLAHENVNWIDNTFRYHGPTDIDPYNDPRGHPPSVVWLGLGGQCVLVACRLQDSVLTDADACANITNVSTFFKGGSGRIVNIASTTYGYPQFFRPSNVRESIIRPPNYFWIPLASPGTAALDRRIDGVVPIRRFGTR